MGHVGDLESQAFYNNTELQMFDTQCPTRLYYIVRVGRPVFYVYTLFILKSQESYFNNYLRRFQKSVPERYMFVNHQGLSHKISVEEVV